MPPPLIGGGIKRCFCLTSVWRLSDAYIGPNLRTERPRKTKIIIGTDIVMWLRHHFQGQKVKGEVTGRFTQRGLNAWGRCSGDRENVLGVGNYCYVASAWRGAGAPTGEGSRRGAGHIVSPRAQLVKTKWLSTKRNVYAYRQPSLHSTMHFIPRRRSYSTVTTRESFFPIAPGMIHYSATRNS